MSSMQDMSIIVSDQDQPFRAGCVWGSGTAKVQGQLSSISGIHGF